MEFTEFAQKIKPIIGGSYSTHVFTRTLFESIITEDGLLQIEDISKNTFKAYYNGQTKITKISQRILPHIEPEQFITYLDAFPDSTTQRLCDTFKSDIKDINLYNANEKLAYYFEEILTVAATQKRNSVNKKDIDETELKLPEKQSFNESLYSSEDNLLLQELTRDYDEIMLVMIGENYDASLLDMTLPRKIKDLFATKWNTKAETFTDLTLKANVYALLGELNQLSSSLLIGDGEPIFFKNLRTKIRNLYVKLHPDKFSGAFPYDAFIDDWDDGEFY